MDTAISFVNWCFTIYILFVFVHVLLSWVQLPYNLWVGRVRTFLHDTVEPYIGLFRRILPPMGGLDLSPIIVFIIIFFLQQMIANFAMTGRLL